GVPIVVKADGLAAGKGVIVCRTEQEALNSIDTIMVRRAFGSAGKKVVIEECLVGEEASFIALTDGRTITPLPSSQDHKAVYDDDEGPNTGGMGAYSPAPVITAELEKEVMETVMTPAVEGMVSEGIPYKGVLYAGLMITNDGPKVLEFNARFGDPETQPILARMSSDIVTALEAVVDGRLGEIEIELDPRPAVCVVMASGGYPGSYDKGIAISGLDEADTMEDLVVFHAGTTKTDGAFTTNGGRVLGVTALGDSIGGAIEKAYAGVEKINWDGVHYRSDIGQKALRR
ncbi:phosphoribosylamine--glycine ligase, partial [Thermodesulfobacteriota bacterium]